MTDSKNTSLRDWRKPKLDINKLAEHFARTPLLVEGVYRGLIESGIAARDSTEPFPGFIFPFSGSAEVAFNGVPFTVTPNTVVHGGERMTLDIKVNGETRWDYLLVLYRVCGDEPEGISLPSAIFDLSLQQSPRMSELLLRLWRISSQPGGIPTLQTETLFRDVLVEMFTCARNSADGCARTVFEQVTAYIHEHYMDALTVPGLAEQSGVNRNRLAYLFNKYAGMGPGEYLQRYRLNRAKELLITSQLPIRSIALAAGFSDPFYFSRVFKKQFAISPSDFRIQFINNPCRFQQESIPMR